MASSLRNGGEEGVEGDFPGGAVIRNLPANVGDARSIPGSRTRRRRWQPVPVLLPAEFHGQRSLADYGPWSHKDSIRNRGRAGSKEQIKAA